MSALGHGDRPIQRPRGPLFAVTPIATLVGCVQSRFFLADLRDAFFMLAFFFSVERFLETTF